MTFIDVEGDSTIRVLALDGGGVRGLLHAKFLSCLEEDRQRPVRELFDVVAGTSTGALIAAGLVAPRRAGLHPLHAETFAQLYRSAARAIFPEPRTFGRTVRTALGRPERSQPLASIYDDYIGPTQLADAEREVCIPALDVANGRAVLFTRAGARAQLHGPRLADVAAASAAAPTYLPTVAINWEGVRGQFVDGGLFANDPTLLTVATLRAKYPRRRVVALSLGAGKGVAPIPKWRASLLGQRASARNLWWLQGALEMAMEGTSDSSVRASRALLGPDYLRLDPDLGAAKPALDDSRLATTGRLIEQAVEHWEGVRDSVWRFIDDSQG